MCIPWLHDIVLRASLTVLLFGRRIAVGTAPPNQRTRLRRFNCSIAWINGFKTSKDCCGVWTWTWWNSDNHIVVWSIAVIYHNTWYTEQFLFSCFDLHLYVVYGKLFCMQDRFKLHGYILSSLYQRYWCVYGGCEVWWTIAPHHVLDVRYMSQPDFHNGNGTLTQYLCKSHPFSVNYNFKTQVFTRINKSATYRE